MQSWLKGRNWVGNVLKKNWTVAQWSKDKSKFLISFGNHGLEEDWRGIESKLLEVQCDVSTVSDDLGCRDVCWCWSIVFYQVQSHCSVYQEILEHFMLPSSDKIYGDADFLFLTDFSTCPQCQNHFKVLCWPWYYCACWPANIPDLNTYGIYGIFSRERWEMVDPTIQTSWRFNSASAVPQADRFHATPHWCWNLC